MAGERAMRRASAAPSKKVGSDPSLADEPLDEEGDRRDLDWSTVMKRTFESYIRGEQPTMYGEWLKW